MPKYYYFIMKQINWFKAFIYYTTLITPTPIQYSYYHYTPTLHFLPVHPNTYTLHLLPLHPYTYTLHLLPLHPYITLITPAPIWITFITHAPIHLHICITLHLLFPKPIFFIISTTPIHIENCIAICTNLYFQ